MDIHKTFIAFLISLLILSCVIGCSKKDSEGNAAIAAPAKLVDRTLLSKLKTSKDEMRDLVFYSYEFKEKNYTDIYLYIVEDKNQALTLRFFLQYYGNNWTFINKAWTKIDGQAVDLPTQASWTRGTDDIFVWEKSDVQLKDSDVLTIKKFASQNNPTIRFDGGEYFSDFKPSSERLHGLLEVLRAYEAAKGTGIN